MLNTADALRVLRAGAPIAFVTVARVTRSAPQGVGATMAVTADARVIGSISGGCVEADAMMLALDALRTGGVRSARLGFGDDAAHAAGLACGGSVEVLAYRVLPTDAVAVTALEDAAADRGVTIGIVASGAQAGELVRLGTAGDDRVTDERVEHAVARRESRMLPGAYDGADLLVVSSAPRPLLIIAGASEHAAALCRIAAASGFSVRVCDAWPLMATPERFPEADEVVAAIPHEYIAGLEPGLFDARSAICVLTHDERLDVPALRLALTLPVGFVGAMGARNTVARRAELLREAGLDEVSLARLRSPLGLDLGGASPEETAISVLAEIIAARYDGSGAPLRDREGPVHRALAAREREASAELSAVTSPCSAVSSHPAAPGRTAHVMNATASREAR